MIFRCTAGFYRAFDALDADAKAQTLAVLAGFDTTPRAPTEHTKIVRDDDRESLENDVWAVDVGATHRLTFSMLNNAHPLHHVCVLRTVGKI